MDHVTFTLPEEFHKAPYKKRNYIPSKIAKYRWLKLSILIGCLVLGILTIAVVSIVLHLINNGSNTARNDTVEDPMQLALSGDHILLYLDAKNRTVHDFDLTSYESGHVGIFEAHGMNDFFWYSEYQSTIFRNIPLVNSSNGFYGKIFKETRVKVQDMAFDFIGENLYVIDKSAGSLIVINVQTQYYTILLTDLTRAHHIQVDPELGLMFILQQMNSILRGNMAGCSLEKLVESDVITAMTVDTKTKRIYWVDQTRGIESSDYNGTNRHTFFMDTLNVIDMAIVNDVMYWLWEEHINDSPTHRLVSCTIVNGTCGDHTVTNYEYLGQFGSIKAIHKRPKPTPLKDNPCSKNNNACQHFCLLSTNGKSNCACKLGWQLDLDEKTCRETKEFMIYTTDKYFRARNLNSARNTSVEVIFKTPYKVDEAESFSFDYDMENDIAFFGNHQTIYMMKLKSNWTGQSIFLQGDNTTNIKDIAFDWVTGNFYYLERKGEEGYFVRVFNVDLGSQYNKTLISSDKAIPNSMAIHPNIGRLVYYTVTKERRAKGTIHVATTNGTEIIDISNGKSSAHGLKSISIDYNDNRIYCITKEFPGGISNTDFNATDIQQITLEESLQIRSVSVHRKWMYVNTYRAIYRLSKENTKNRLKLAPVLSDQTENWISAVKIYSDSIRSSKENKANPCSIRNGGCQQFCFLDNGKALCECRDGETLGPQGQCVEIPKKVEIKKEEFKEKETKTEEIKEKETKTEEIKEETKKEAIETEEIKKKENKEVKIKKEKIKKDGTKRKPVKKSV